jgi:hypothetical protein
MDWKALGHLCHQPEYRVGEELAMLRTEAKSLLDQAQAAEAEAAPAPTGETPVTAPVELASQANPPASILKSSQRIRLAATESE